MEVSSYVSSLLSRYSPTGPGRSVVPTSSASSRASTESRLIDSQSDTGFIQKLEKHLDDVRKGRGQNSTDVAGKIRREEFGLGDGLGAKRARDLYAYVGALNYDERARMVHAVKELREDVATIIG